MKIIRNLIGLVSFLVVCGCSDISALQLKYDPIEYHLISKIRTEAEISKISCDDPVFSKNQATLLYNQTLEYMNYTQYLLHDVYGNKAAIELNTMAQGLRDQYANNTTVSPLFCKIKFQNIEISAENIQKVIGVENR